MAVGDNFERLKAHILPLSHSDIFEVARSEWHLAGVNISEDLGSCPCGQDIKGHCYITNRIAGESTCVGNVCINKAIGTDTGTPFDGLNRFAEDPYANANLEVIKRGLKLGFIYESEYKFLWRRASSESSLINNSSGNLKSIAELPSTSSCGAAPAPLVSGKGHTKLRASHV